MGLLEGLVESQPRGTQRTSRLGAFVAHCGIPAVGSEPEPDCVDLASQGTFFFSVHDSLAWARGSGGHLGPEAGSQSVAFNHSFNNCGCLSMRSLRCPSRGPQTA